VPAVANEVVSVATPELKVPVPSEVVPDMKVTVPVAVDGATVAVNVTLAPTAGVAVDAARTVVVAVLVEVTVMLTALDVLVAKVVDPA
jgi:hypothetical protein